MNDKPNFLDDLVEAGQQICRLKRRVRRLKREVDEGNELEIALCQGITRLTCERDACLAAVRAYMDRDHSLPELAQVAIALCEQEQPTTPTERTR